MRRGGTKGGRASPTFPPHPGRVSATVGQRNYFLATLLENEKLFTLLVMVWLSLLLYGDVIVFSRSVVECGQRLGVPMNAHQTTAPRLSAVTRILFVSDPQLTSPYSYHFMQSRLLNSLVSLYSDLYMRRAYVTIQSFLHPEAVFFNGDLFDGVTAILNEHDQCVFSGISSTCVSEQNLTFASSSSSSSSSPLQSCCLYGG